MTLEFLKFKKKINKKNDFKLEFILDGAKSLAIISCLLYTSPSPRD